MSQSSPKAKTKNKAKTKKTSNAKPAQPKERPKCHIHDKIKGWKVDWVRQNVCVPAGAHSLEEFEGKNYCLFHLPTIDKNIDKFEKIFQTRLEAVDDKCADIEAEFADDEEKQIETKRERNIIYDFRYVWFPSKVNLYSKKFKSNADFSLATFTLNADFSLAKFTSSANFRSATFTSNADFSLATFTSDADIRSVTFTLSANFWSATFISDTDFSSVTFTSDANFSLATFTSDAYFISATFTSYADFSLVTFTSSTDYSSVTFTSSAYFISTTFEEKSQIFYQNTTFESLLIFSNAEFKGYVKFVGNKDNYLFTEEDSVLDLQDARIDDAKKISFHTVRLEPSWFVNTDATEIRFTDCQWRYLSDERLNINTELENLRDKKEIESPNVILTKACWQLAESFENSKSFAKASLAREIAQESKRLATVWYKQPLTLHWLYFISSRYGESWIKAFIVLSIMLFVFFPFGYALADFQVCSKEKPLAFSLREDKESLKCAYAELDCNCAKRALRISNGEVFAHSLSTATFQNVQHRLPLTIWGELWMILQRIFIPLQTALLALAIRRKFMR